MKFSMQFVVAKKRRSRGGSPSFSTVSVSSRRTESSAPPAFWSRSAVEVAFKFGRSLLLTRHHF